MCPDTVETKVFFAGPIGHRSWFGYQAEMILRWSKVECLAFAINGGLCGSNNLFKFETLSVYFHWFFCHKPIWECRGTRVLTDIQLGLLRSWGSAVWKVVFTELCWISRCNHCLKVQHQCISVQQPLFDYIKNAFIHWKFFQLQGSMSGSGYLRLYSAAMVLASVDELSGEEAPNTGGDSAPKAKAKPKPKSESSKPSPKPKPTAKAIEKKSTKNTKKESPKKDEEPEVENEEEPKKKPVTKVLKRPAAAGSKASQQPEPKKLKVNHYRYKTGKWGFKLNGSEKFSALSLAHMLFRNTVWCF